VTDYACDFKTNNKQETFNVKVKSHPHIRFLPTHPHSISAAHICILPLATSADPHIRFLPIASRVRAGNNYAVDAVFSHTVLWVFRYRTLALLVP